MIDRGGVFLWDMAIAHGLANHRPILAFGQGVIVSLTQTRFSEFDATSFLLLRLFPLLVGIWLLRQARQSRAEIK